MQNHVRYRAMEQLCRQSAVFHPLESWRLLAEAEMWHHKAQDELALNSALSAPERVARSVGAAARPGSGGGNAGGASRLLG